MNGVFEKIEYINYKLKLIGVIIAGIATFLMMVIIVVDVFMRNVFVSPLSGTYEIVQFYLMPMAVFPALAYTYSSGVLPRLDELVAKAPERFRKISAYIIVALEFIIFTLLTIYGWKFAMVGVEDQMAIAVGGVLTPVYPLYFIVPIGFALVVIEIVLSAIKQFKYNT